MLESDLQDLTKGWCVPHMNPALAFYLRAKKNPDDPEVLQIKENLIEKTYQGLLIMHYGIVRALPGAPDFWKAYNGLYQECRGVVIDTTTDTLAMTPFKKFLNVGEATYTSPETLAKKVKNASLIEVSEKLDGTMIQARLTPEGRLLVATGKTLDPNRSHQLKSAKAIVEDDPRYLPLLEANQEKTLIFEYIGDDDPHVIPYEDKDKGLRLIGMRSIEDGKEATYKTVREVANAFGIPTTRLFDLDLDGALERLQHDSDLLSEGFVISIDGYKVKAKYPDYIRIHTMASNLSNPDAVIRAIREDTLDDAIATLPKALRQSVEETAEFVYDYVHKFSTKLSDYTKKLGATGLTERGDVMRWISKNVDPIFQAPMREQWLGREIDPLRSGGKTIKMKEIQERLNAKMV